MSVTPANTSRKRGRKPGNRLSVNRRKLPGARPGPGTPTGRTGRAGQREMHRELDKLARRERVYELVAVHRLTFAQAGRQLGVSNKTAWEDFRAVVSGRAQRLALQADEWVAAELDAMQASERHLMPLVLGTAPAMLAKQRDPLRREHLRLAAVGRLLEVQKRRAALLGLDAQPETGYSEPQVQAMLRGLTAGLLHAFQGAQERRLIAQVIRKQLPVHGGDGNGNGNEHNGNGDGHAPAREATGGDTNGAAQGEGEPGAGEAAGRQPDGHAGDPVGGAGPAAE